MNEDSDNQESLWTPDELRTTVAETTLLHFTAEYKEWMQNRTGGELLPRNIDEVSFACILLCEEHGDTFSPDAAMELNNCRRIAAESGGIEWLDVMPWDLAIESLGTQTGDPTRGTRCEPDSPFVRHPCVYVRFGLAGSRQTAQGGIC